MPNILITGGEQEDRFQEAMKQATRLLCTNPNNDRACAMCSNCRRSVALTHPNLIFVEPKDGAKTDAHSSQTGTIKIEQIRDIVIESQKANFEAGRSVIMITHMHRCTIPAQNALLKVMEDNPDQKIIIALAPSRTAVLPTIASRLVSLSIKPSKTSYSSCSAEARRVIWEVSTTKPQLRFPLCETFGTERDALITQFDDILHACQVMLHKKEVQPLFALRLGEAVERAGKNLKANLNPRLVTEKLILREWPYINK